jgi:hypothetical protein
MKQVRNLLLAAALIAGLSPALAQQFPTVPSGTVIGRTQFGPGPAQAISINQLLATMLSGPLTIPSINTNSIVYKGATSGQATVSAQAVAGTPTIVWPNTSGTVADNATAPIVLNATTGNISCPTCVTSVNTPLLASRAIATAANLTGQTVVQTQGYATAGDGGGATFKNVGSAAFADSGILTGAITAGGSGYTNGTYLFVNLAGGSGSNAIASVTVSGGAVTSVTIRGTGGNAYTAGDVLFANNSFLGGSGSGFTWTVSTVSTPTGSFTDAGGNHWQITPDQGNFINVRQFGAKVDWTGNDATATNDFTAIQNAYNYASIISGPTIDAGGAAGAKVIHPRGTSLVCSASTPLHVPMGVSVEGHNAWASTLKMCTTWNNATHFITLCDPNTHIACFGTRLHNLTLFAVFTQVSAAATAMVYSNNIQQIDVLDRVAIYAGQRACIRFETGFGGAALLGMQNIECTPSNVGSQNPGIFINYGTTLITMRNVHVEGSGPAVNSGIFIGGGFVDLVGFHTEGWNVGIEVNIPTSNANGIVRLHGLSGGASCTNLVLKQSGSAANSLIVGQAIMNGCTNAVNNGGTLTATTIVGDTVF